MTISNTAYYLYMDEAFWWKTSKAFLPIILLTLCDSRLCPFERGSRCERSELLSWSMQLIVFQVFVISILMSNETQICSLTLQPFWNAAFKTWHLFKLLTPLQQHEHVSPAITPDGQILAPLFWAYLCSQSHWNYILSSSTSLLP